MIWAGAAAFCAGCKPDGAAFDMQSSDAQTRAKAIRLAADRNDRKVIPLIVDRLEDEDQSVRLFAILALEKMAGTRMGYLYYRPPGSQEVALRKWREYAANPGSGVTAVQSPSTRKTEEAASQP